MIMNHDHTQSPCHVSQAIAEALRDGPLLAAARVDRAIRAACPDLSPWAYRHVAQLVAAGNLPEHEIAAALARFREAESSRTIANRPAYLAAVLKRCLADHGQPWRKAQ
jgi:hypothetical protein